ncbi:MAG: DUF4386 domain-containing protein [Candidatus Methanoperedenaceae archaeon]|nr:MAG: DUF4386 domain-containing protein [Candidatus Methanoperedenaceae archaeon]
MSFKSSMAAISEQSYRKLVAVLLILGAVLANIAFIGLGSVFNYPDILQEPAKEILRQFMTNQNAIIFWFSILAIGAGLLAPIAVILGHLGSTCIAVWTGVLAAVVQVIGLSRWILIVPGLAQKGDVATFQLLNTILGTIVGETFRLFLLLEYGLFLSFSPRVKILEGRGFHGWGLSRQFSLCSVCLFRSASPELMALTLLATFSGASGWWPWVF